MTTPARTAELIEMSKGLYLTVVGLTSGPPEATALITMIHLTLFLNHGDPSFTVDDMLADYNRNFKKNWTANKAQAS